MMNKLIQFLGLLLQAGSLFTGSVGVASAYVGDWLYETNPEYMILFDNESGQDLILEGTTSYCQYPGSSYPTMHSVLQGARGGEVHWWIANSCNNDDYLRICIENQDGDSACSTYFNSGWEDTY